MKTRNFIVSMSSLRKFSPLACAVCSNECHLTPPFVFVSEPCRESSRENVHLMSSTIAPLSDEQVDLKRQISDALENRDCESGEVV